MVSGERVNAWNRLNIIPVCNSEISAVAKQSLAKLRNNLREHPTTESTLLEEEALFEFFLPNKGRALNECADFLLCFVLQGSVLLSHG